MERYLRIGSSFLRKQYLPHLLVTLLFCIMSGFFVSFRNLSPGQTAKVMEMYVIFVGILLFTPLFMPEQNREIWLLEKSKCMALWQVYLVRVFQAIVILALVVTVFIGILHLGNSEFQIVKLWIGAFCEICFLGSVGFFVSGITNQVVLGYMVSILYFVGNIGGSEYFGKLALFQMIKEDFTFVPWMAVVTVILLISGIVIREKINQ